jgi:hypothetical protein
MAVSKGHAACAALACAASMFGASDVSAKNRYALEPPEVEHTAAFRYAEMTSAQCLAELDKRKVPYKLAGPTKQVDTPIRFTGPVRGVEFIQTYRPAPDLEEPLSAIADCRLAVAIDDFAGVLAEHGITKVEYLSMYRTKGVGFVRPGKRHPAALAIDVAVLHRKDGATFSVLGDWHGRAGSKTCGEGASKPTKDTEGARVLREIICETDQKKSFNLMLTPHYDWGHKDHFHLEVRQNIRWFLTQ